jgi:hypothetical protein
MNGSRNILLLQLRVFRFGVFEDGNVGICIFPERKEILVGGACLGRITHEFVRPPLTDDSKRNQRIQGMETMQIADALELVYGFLRLASTEVGDASKIGLD